MGHERPHRIRSSADSNLAHRTSAGVAPDRGPSHPHSTVRRSRLPAISRGEPQADGGRYPWGIHSQEEPRRPIRRGEGRTPVMLTPLSVLAALLIAFLASRVWGQVDHAHRYIAQEASAIQQCLVSAEALPIEVGSLLSKIWH